MRKCPFCGKEPYTGFPQLMYLDDLEKWSFQHCCNENGGIAVFITADTKEELFELWEHGVKNAADA